MKRYLTILLSTIVCINIAAQENTIKKERYTYLWDVTISMVGVGVGNPDIYDEVMELIIDDINNIPQNDETEIVVVAFRGNLDKRGYRVWKNVASSSGKKQLAKEMENFPTSRKKTIAENPDRGNTNTYTALKYVVNNILSADRVDYLKIMTDGGCDEFAQLSSLIEGWCEIKEEKDVYAYYITLTEKARTSETGQKGLEKKVDSLCFKFVPDPAAIDQIRMLNLVNSLTHFNLMTDKGKKLTYNFNVALGDCKIAPGLKLHCKTKNNSNDIFTIDEVVEFDISTNSITLTPKVNEYAQHTMSGDECRTIELEFKVENTAKFPYVTVEPQVHPIILENEVQTLTVTNDAFDCYVRSTEPALRPKFSSSKGNIKPGFKVNYRIEDPRNLINASGTGEINEHMLLEVGLSISQEAKNSEVLEPKTRHKGAKLLLSPAPENGDNYKNVVFEDCELEVILINDTFRKVKVYVE